MPLNLDRPRRREIIDEMRAQEEATEQKERKHVREFSEEGVVRIWRDRDAVTSGHFGHAAMSLRGPGLADNSGQGIYISWWPDGNAGFIEGVQSLFGEEMEGQVGDSYRADKYDEISESATVNIATGIYTPRNGQSIIPLPQGYSRDAAFRMGPTYYVYAQSVDAKIRLPGCRAEGVWFGLDLAAIQGFWNEFLATNPKYQLASRTNSCAGVVRRALKAGGGKAFAHAPRSELYALPSEMEDWALRIRARLDELNRNARTFMNRLTVSRQTPVLIGHRQGLAQHQVYTTQTWRRVSARTNGVRGKNVASIDRHLDLYHQPVISHRDAERRMKARVDIFEIVLRAVLRDRHAHDEDVLKRLGRAILEARC